MPEKLRLVEGKVVRHVPLQNTKCGALADLQPCNELRLAAEIGCESALLGAVGHRRSVVMSIGSPNCVSGSVWVSGSGSGSGSGSSSSSGSGSLTVEDTVKV